MATDLSDLTATWKLIVEATAKKATDLTVPSETLNLTKTLKFIFGTGAGQVDQVFHDRRTLAGGASEELDLAGALTNAFGATVTFAKIKGIAIINRSNETLDGHSPTDADLDIGGAAANAFQGPFVDSSDKLNLAAGAPLLIAKPDADGWTVTAGTGDLLKIENKDGSEEAVYDIVLVGEAA